MTMRKDALKIAEASIRSVQPDTAVCRALSGFCCPEGRLVLVALGKAAWQMAKAAVDCLGDHISEGVVITKYGHSKGPISNLCILEGGHPVPDENSYLATKKAMELVQGLDSKDAVLLLISGGGSALFEKPLCSPEELSNLTEQLLACGADIVEINTLRKRVSAVKGGRFGELCAPARVFSIVLSDILGDPLDMIASGPACVDRSTSEQALGIVKKYGLQVSKQVLELLERPLPKALPHVTTNITGSVRELCAAAAKSCQELGYEPFILTDSLCCEAREAGSFLASIACSHQNAERPLAFLAGGETVVHVTGTGKGGRNQELALGAAKGLSGISGALVFSVGSDGTDGPTDAAGGMADGGTYLRLKEKGIDPEEVLANNDAYYALKADGGLIITGPTGTNVNDVAVLLLNPGQQE